LDISRHIFYFFIQSTIGNNHLALEARGKRGRRKNRGGVHMIYLIYTNDMAGKVMLSMNFVYIINQLALEWKLLSSHFPFNLKDITSTLGQHEISLFEHKKLHFQD